MYLFVLFFVNILCFSALFGSSMEEKKNADVKLLYTAALIDTCYESRKTEYITSLEKLQEYGIYEPYIVEAIKEGESTFFESYSSHVCYSQVNDKQLQNKGVNESKSILESFKFFSFDPEDMIVKITGRYCFSSRQFLDLLADHPSFDAFVTLDPYGQVFTGCFALRYKFFKEMLESLNYVQMERYMINIEKEVADYIARMSRSGRLKVLYVDHIDMVANIFGRGPLSGD